MSKTIKQFIARGSDGHKHYAGDFFEVEAETLDEAQEILIEDGFKGFLYEETYQWISTTPHYIDSKLSEYSKVLYQIKETGRGDYILESVVPTNFGGDAVNYVFRGRLEDCEKVRDELLKKVTEAK